MTVVAFISGLAFGLAPALSASEIDLTETSRPARKNLQAASGRAFEARW